MKRVILNNFSYNKFSKKSRRGKLEKSFFLFQPKSQMLLRANIVATNIVHFESVRSDQNKRVRTWAGSDVLMIFFLYELKCVRSINCGMLIGKFHSFKLTVTANAS